MKNNKHTSKILKIPCPDCKKPLHFVHGNWFECKDPHCHVIKVFVRVHRDAIFSKSLFLAAMLAIVVTSGPADKSEPEVGLIGLNHETPKRAFSPVYGIVYSMYLLP